MRDRAIARAEVKPLEVMLAVLASRWREALSLEASLAGIEDAEQAQAARTQLLLAQSAAFSAAERVAPYVHAKLAAMTIKGDETNPLTLMLSQFDPSALRAAIRGPEPAENSANGQSRPADLVVVK